MTPHLDHIKSLDAVKASLMLSCNVLVSYDQDDTVPQVLRDRARLAADNLALAIRHIVSAKHAITQPITKHELVQSA